MISSSSHGVSFSLVTSFFARQQVDVLSASHGPVVGSRRLGYQPVAPICSKVIVPPCDGGSSSPGPNVAAPSPESGGGGGEASRPEGDGVGWPPSPAAGTAESVLACVVDPSAAPSGGPDTSPGWPDEPHATTKARAKVAGGRRIRVLPAK